MGQDGILMQNVDVNAGQKLALIRKVTRYHSLPDSSTPHG